MYTNRKLMVAGLLLIGALIPIGVAIILFSVRDLHFWMLAASTTAVIAGSLLYCFGTDSAALRRSGKKRHAADGDQHQDEHDTFESLQQQIMSELMTREQTLVERERDLAAKLVRFQEFLEYPEDELHEDLSSPELLRLSEQDREVNRILEEEAERVYEKIRRNGYSNEGKVDVRAIRDDALDLIRRVARIYKPDSEFPLLETSFEHLTRAGSRVCLHALVLMEQLPLNVQQYSINTLYAYIRKAVVGYGVYQKASPWLSFLGRSFYVGRMAATTNPAALGAWWLASEVGKRGAQKVMENVVDRQAIALLHSLVTVVGVEAAGIYGKGFRQRDPAWILGTELVELIHSFPPSGESLRRGMEAMTTLPLRCEYDRIYLYRCLATHRSAGHHLPDSAMLSRDVREKVARSLEKFFLAYIHGVTPANVKKWRNSVEQRLDLKLNLESSTDQKSAPPEEQAFHAVVSLRNFLVRFVTSDPAELIVLMRRMHCVTLLKNTPVESLMTVLSPNTMSSAGTEIQNPERPPDSRMSAVFAGTDSEGIHTEFEPPELDPSSDITRHFLNDLALCATMVEPPDEHLEQLVRETWCYFRRTTAEAESAIVRGWRQKLRWHCVEASTADAVSDDAVRAFFNNRIEEERLIFCYGDLSRRSDGSTIPIPGYWLFATESGGNNSTPRRRAFVAGRNPGETVWTSQIPLHVERVSGLVVDDARVVGGTWSDDQQSSVSRVASGNPEDAILISGSLRGGRFRNYFRSLLQHAVDSKLLTSEVNTAVTGDVGKPPAGQL